MTGFEGFRDSPEAPFYRAGASSPDDTWAEAARRVNLVIESAAAAARHRPIEMTVERICHWHRAIFLTTFAHDAGRVREDYEHAGFGIPIEIDGELITSPMQGVLPRSAILARLRAACETLTPGELRCNNAGSRPARSRARRLRPSSMPRSSRSIPSWTATCGPPMSHCRSDLYRWGCRRFALAG